MKKIFLILFGLILCTNAYAKTKFSEVKKALKEDGYGKAIPEKFHHLNSPKAINPVSVSDFSILGDKSIIHGTVKVSGTTPSPIKTTSIGLFSPLEFSSRSMVFD